ncbi:MAG TPA: glycoside hydrolase family 16 protein [Gemmatimonadaceae bacterium]|nr:glycoside hydrolase family 16 protein [Gemmatimonadaceae bacterium]
MVHPTRSLPIVFALATLAAGACGGGNGGPKIEPLPAGPPLEYQLYWSDEFSGPAGAAPDPTKWVHDTGGQGWGNNELQYYTPGNANAAMDGNGNLVITARAEPETTPLSCRGGPCRYTSARIKTKGRYEPFYGKIEARMKLPRGQGVWPAFWMLGANIDVVGWPQCGEIDIMENIGREPSTVHGTVHGPGYSGANGIGGSYSIASPFADDFHVFAVEWEAGSIKWFVDGNLYRTLTPSDLPTGTVWAFERNYFMLLNLAIGGAWPGNPDASTVFPQQLVVDYVRVYKLR